MLFFEEARKCLTKMNTLEKRRQILLKSEDKQARQSWMRRRRAEEKLRIAVCYLRKTAEIYRATEAFEKALKHIESVNDEVLHE